MRLSDPANNLDEVRARLTPWFADKVEDGAATVDRLSPISGGLVNAIYIATIVLSSGEARRFVLRWDPVVGPQAPYNMANQFATFERLRLTDIPVPAPHWLETDTNVLGRQFWVAEFVEAQTVGRMIDPRDPLAAARMSSFIKMLDSIHGADWRLAGLDHVRPIVADADLDAMIEVETPLFAGISTADDKRLFERAREFLKSTAPRGFGLCLTHGDCSLSNYMFDAARIVAVVDWDLSSITDRVRDIGFYCSLIFRFNPQTPKAVKETQRSLFIEAYERQSNATLASLTFWEAYANFHNALSWTRPGWPTTAGGYIAYKDRLEQLIRSC